MTIVTNPACSNSNDDVQTMQPSTSRIRPSEVYSETNDNTEYLVEDLVAYRELRKPDFTIIAGIDGDTCSFPVHRQTLVCNSPVFKALLNDPSNTIVIDYVDRRGMRQLLRYYYSQAAQLTAASTARSTLHAAYCFLCPKLAEIAARRLDEMLDTEVALEVLRDLRYLCTHLPGAASAPPLPAFENDEDAYSFAICAKWCDSLAHNALLVIDDHADVALAHKCFENLSYEDLSLIAKRKTLRVSSELLFAEALARWSTAACKRMRRELTPSNKRAALGELAYCPRYLLLSVQELDRALALELLQPIEKALVLGRAHKRSTPIPVGSEQENMLRQWATPRPTEPAAAPVYLSIRSEPFEDIEPSICCVRRRKKKQTKFGPEGPYKSKNGCFSNFCHGFIHALVCLFD